MLLSGTPGWIEEFLLGKVKCILMTIAPQSPAIGCTHESPHTICIFHPTSSVSAVLLATDAATRGLDIPNVDVYHSSACLPIPRHSTAHVAGQHEPGNLDMRQCY